MAGKDRKSRWTSVHRETLRWLWSHYPLSLSSSWLRSCCSVSTHIVQRLVTYSSESEKGSLAVLCWWLSTNICNNDRRSFASWTTLQKMVLPQLYLMIDDSRYKEMITVLFASTGLRVAVGTYLPQLHKLWISNNSDFLYWWDSMKCFHLFGCSASCIYSDFDDLCAF